MNPFNAKDPTAAGVISPGGIQDTLKGQTYQFKIILSFLLKCQDDPHVWNFAIGTELKDAETFDDVVLNIDNIGTRFLQAKFSKAAFNFELNTLMEEKNYRLKKYFEAFLKLKERFFDIKDVIIATNNKFKNSQNEFIELMDANKYKIYFSKVKINDLLFGNFEYRFKLKGEDHLQDLEIKNYLKFYFIFQELFICTKPKKVDDDKKCKFTMMKSYRKFLQTEVFDESNCVFLSDFISNSNPNTKLLYDLLKTKKVDIQNVQLNFLDQIYDNFTNDPIDLVQFEIEMEKSLDEFIDKLLFVTQFTRDDIDQITDPLLQKDFNRENVSYIREALEAEILNWVIDLKDGDFIDSRKLKLLYQGKINVLTKVQNVMERTSNILRGDLLEFNAINQELQEFLSESVHNLDKNVFGIQTTPEETYFGLCQVVQNIKSARCDTFLILQTSFSQDIFEEGLHVFSSEKSFEVCVVEVNSKKVDFTKFRDEFIRVAYNDSKKLIIICDTPKLLSGISAIKSVSLEEVLLPELTLSSLDKILNTTIKLQAVDTTFGEILDKNNPNLINEIYLNDLFTNKSIGNIAITSKTYDKGLYIPRTLSKKIRINKDIEKSSDAILAFNELDFENFSTRNPDKNVHFLNKRGFGNKEYLEWKNTSGNMYHLQKYIDHENFDEYSEDNILTLQNPVSKLFILVDVVGKGKSSFFNYMAENLKKMYPGHFICNIALNSFTESFEDKTYKHFQDVDSVINFLSTDVLELENEFQEKVFRNACTVSGKVQILLDGLDEISPYYETPAFNMLEVLSKLKIHRIFVSTRPELGYILENKFKQLRYELMPFSEQDQKNFLVKFWFKNSELKEEDALKKISERVIHYLNESIADQKNSFTGIPLITRLVAEILNDEILDIENKLQLYVKENFFNIYDIFKSFIDKKMDIYIKEKLQMVPTNVQAKKLIQKEKQEIWNFYQQYALNKLLDRRITNRLMILIFDEEILEKMIKCGLVIGDEKYYDFVHLAFAEFLVGYFFIENLAEENVAEIFLRHLVFTVAPNYNVINAFISSGLDTNFPSETCKVYNNILLSHHSLLQTFEQFLNMTHFEESNIFLLLIHSLIEFDDGEPSKKEKVEDFFNRPNRKQIIFSHYFKNINDQLKLLEKFKRKLGNDFVKSVLEMEHLEKTSFETVPFGILHFTLSNRDMVVQVLKFLRVNFLDDPNFVEKIILNRTSYSAFTNKKPFLHEIFDNPKLMRKTTPSASNYNSQGLELFFKILVELSEISKILKLNHQEDFIEKLILSVDDNGKSLLHYMALEKISSKKIVEFLDWTKINFGLETVQKLMALKSYGKFLFWVHYYQPQKIYTIILEIIKTYYIDILQWVQENFSQEIDEFSTQRSNPIEKFLDQFGLLEYFKQYFTFDLKVIFYLENLNDSKNDSQILDFLVALFLLENLESEDVAKAIVKLFDTKLFEIVKLPFSNFLKSTPENLLNFGKLLKDMGVKKELTFRALEGDLFLNVQEFMLNSIMKLAEIETDKSAIESILLDDSNKISEIFYKSFKRQHFLSLGFANGTEIQELCEKFSKSFIEKLFYLKNSDGTMFLHFAWGKIFSEKTQAYIKAEIDFEVFKKAVLSEDSNGNSILFQVFSAKSTLYNVDLFLDFLKKNFSKDELQKLFGHRNKAGKLFLHNPCGKTTLNQFLQFMAENFEESFWRELITSEDKNGDTILTIINRDDYEILRFAGDFVLSSEFDDISYRIFKKLLDLNFSRDFLLHKNNSGRNFLFKIGSCAELEAVLELMKKSFDESLFIQELYVQDNQGNNLLFSYIMNTHGFLMVELFIEFVHAENFKKLLEMKNSKGQNFLFNGRTQRNLDFPQSIVTERYGIEFLKSLLRTEDPQGNLPISTHISFFNCWEIYEEIFNSNEMREILEHRNSAGQNFIYFIRNLTVLGECLRDIKTNFGEEFMRKLVTTRGHSGDTFLFNFVKHSGNFYKLKENLGCDVLSELFRVSNNQGNIFVNNFSNPSILEEVIVFLKYEISYEIMESSIFSKNNLEETILFEIWDPSKLSHITGIFKVFEYHLNIDILQKLLEIKNLKNQNFLHKFELCDTKSSTYLIELLDFILFHFNTDVLVKLLTDKDVENLNFLERYAKIMSNNSQRNSIIDWLKANLNENYCNILLP